MTISASMVKELRERTGVGMMDCKAALTEAQGDLEKASDILRKKGMAKAAKKSDRETAEGRVGVYVHPGDRVGVMVEVNCETDFAARNDEFRQMVSDICLHIAAMSPEVVSPADLDPARVAKEREVFEAQVRQEGKPENMVEKIVDGKVTKWYSEVCLIHQPFVKDDKQTVGDYLTSMIAKIGENMKIRRFTRYELGK
jgi:elongation factor Ts